jgi:threonine dehydratase
VNWLETLPDDIVRARGIIAASTGNHGQGVARAAAVLGVQATVCVPENAAAVKIAPMRAMGCDRQPVKCRIRC